MKYRLYPNVSIEQVCGVHLLIASGNAARHFDYVRVLNETGAEILLMAAEGKDTIEVLHEISKQYEVDEEDIYPGVLRFLSEMESAGYLLPMAGEE